MKSRTLLIGYLIVALAALLPLLALAEESSPATKAEKLATKSHWIISPKSYDFFINSGNVVAIYPGISFEEDRFFIYILGSYCTSAFPTESIKFDSKQKQVDLCESDPTSVLASTINQRALLLVKGKIIGTHSNPKLQATDSKTLESLKEAIYEKRSTFPAPVIHLIEAISNKETSASIVGKSLRLSNEKQSVEFLYNPFPDPTTPTDLTYVIGLPNGRYFRCLINESLKLLEFDVKTGFFDVAKTRMDLEFRRSMIFRETKLTTLSPNTSDEYRKLQKEFQSHYGEAEKKYLEAEKFLKSKLHCNL